MVKKKKKRRRTRLFVSFTVKDDQGNIVSVNRQGETSPPSSILSLYANPKDVSSRDLFHGINPSLRLSKSEQLDREIRFYPFYFAVCFGSSSLEGLSLRRLISGIENEKEGKEGFWQKKKKKSESF